jgi:transcriptional regulator with PAS, ATPase and Fis domain
LDQAQKKLTRSQKHKIEDHAIAMLSTYGWPGNVRQLRHVVDRLVATASQGATITVDDIHAALPGTALTATSQIPLVYH